MNLSGYFFNQNSRIARRLIIYLVLFSSFITLIMTSLQIYHDYRSEIQNIEVRLAQIETVIVPNITASLWATSHEDLQLQLDGIIRMPDMLYAGVMDNKKAWATAGVPQNNNSIQKTISLQYTDQGKTLEIGKLILFANLNTVYQRLIDKIWMILISNAIKTFLVVSFVYFIFHRLITRNLIYLAQHVKNLRLPEALTPLVLPRKPSQRSDVLDDVVTAINAMQENLQQAFKAIADSEQRFRILVQQFQGISYQTKPGELQPLLLQAKVKEITGYEACDLISGKIKWEQIINPDDLQMVIKKTREFDHRSTPTFNLVYRIRHANGEIRWLKDLKEIVEKSPSGEVVLQGTIYDITDLKLAEEKYLDAKERAEVTLHSIGEAVITTDDQSRVDYLNPIAEELTGWKTADGVGQALNQIFKLVKEDPHYGIDNIVEHCVLEGQVFRPSGHRLLITRTGQEIAIEKSVAPIHNRTGKIIGIVLIFRDVTKSRAQTQQLEWQASHDILTGLFNRSEFENRVSKAITQAQQEGGHHVLLYIDLDQFKIINDTCGHVAGDDLLKKLSALMQNKMRSSDILARLGGDEFGVFLVNCPLDQAIRIANELQQISEKMRFSWDKRFFEISCSIGLVEINHFSGSLAQIMSAADMACYTAKDSGRNRLHVYQETDKDMARRHGEMLWVGRIQEALKIDNFILYQQKIVPIKNSELSHHFEILVRMHDDQGQIILPSAFIPAAERYYLMPALDRWVIKRAFESYGDIYPQYKKLDFMMSINISGSSLGDESLLNYVLTYLDNYQVTPTHVCFEITETAAITHLPRATQFIQELRRIGVKFALDDFGSGLSSFVYLRNLAVDFLKIDGSLVRHIAANPIDGAMISAINEIGHIMGIKTVAECVENQAIWDELTKIGIDYVQGFGVEMPQPLALLFAPVHQLSGPYT